jgi:hypothetical protein
MTRRSHGGGEEQALPDEEALEAAESASRPPSGFWCLNDKTIKELIESPLILPRGRGEGVNRLF